ncbi:hypothetical protein V1508DRAFT_361066 [Lipomyces doorenjongii]|uniref:uncharacterized protein n=1 Tax=Lipomyces doorenjongii TaxID=383834 RepID=UPI0034CEFD3E
MDIDVEERPVYEHEYVNDIENMSVDEKIHVPGEEDAIGEEEMMSGESGDTAEPIQTGEVVPYGHGVIRRREERSPDTSDGEGQGKEVVKRTRRNPGREIVLRDDTAYEDDWRPVETGMVLRADGTVIKPDDLEGDAPHEGHNQASQPRRHWGVVVPSTFWTFQKVSVVFWTVPLNEIVVTRIWMRVKELWAKLLACRALYELSSEGRKFIAVG